MQAKSPPKSNLRQPTQQQQHFSPFVVHTDSSPHPNMDISRRTLTVFDWDDTLFCSSHLASMGLRLDSAANEIQCMEHELKKMADSIIKVLCRALDYGPITVITNAEAGWIELCAEKFIPRVCPYLKKVTLFSARSCFEPTFPDAPLKWKYHAFMQSIQEANSLTWARIVTTPSVSCVGHKEFEEKEEELINGKEKTLIVSPNIQQVLYTHHIVMYTRDISKNVRAETPTHVLSFGDSHVERNAVHACTRKMEHHRTKSIKFITCPTIHQLCRELELVVTCFPQIYSFQDDLDLQLCITDDDEQSTIIQP